MATWHAAAALTLLCAAPARMQPPDTPVRLERVADRVYVILHPDATEDRPTSNTGVVIGDDGVLVVDTGYLPSIAREDIGVIQSLTDKPVRYVVYTHAEFDHTNGAIAYRQAFPSVDVVSERSTATHMESHANEWLRAWTGPGAPALEELRDLDSQLRSGRGPGDRPFSTEDRARLEQKIRQRDREQQELSSLKVVVPTLVFDQALSLTLGTRRIQLTNHGRAMSASDTTVYVPDAQVLFTGDIVVQSPLPFARSSWPASWVNVLRRVEATPAVALVPGHGPVLKDRTYPAQMRLLLERVLAEVGARARAGMTLEQAQNTVDLNDVRQQVAAWRNPSLDAAWKRMVNTLLERAWPL